MCLYVRIYSTGIGRKICDEIFGEENFVASFIWEKHRAPKNDNDYVTLNHEFVLLFAKNKENFSIKKLQRSKKNLDSFKNPDNDPRGVWVSGPLLAPTFSSKTVFEILTPNGRHVMPPQGKCWAFSKNRIDELIVDNRIWFGENGGNTPRIKRFLSELPNGIGVTSCPQQLPQSGNTQISTRRTSMQQLSSLVSTLTREHQRLV